MKSDPFKLCSRMPRFHFRQRNCDHVGKTASFIEWQLNDVLGVVGAKNSNGNPFLYDHFYPQHLSNRDH